MATPYEIDEPEGSQKGSYLSKKDLRTITLVIVVLIILMTPVYNGLRETANEHLCYQNLSQISKGIGLYVSQNDDRLPPAYLKSGDDIYLDANFRPFT